MHMKTRFSFVLGMLLACQIILAEEVHITITNPETWTTDELTPYVGKTVIFDSPLIIADNNVSSSSITVSPRMLFTPVNQAFPRTTANRTVASMNSKGAMTLSGLSNAYSYRCRGKVYNLKAKVNSTTSLTWQDKSGKWVGETRSYLESHFPELGDYRLLVCAMNIENYFIANGLHSRQRDKVINAMAFINADIYGLIEMEGGSDGVQEVTTYLNTALKSKNREYKYIGVNTSSKNTDQTVVYVYDSKKVKPRWEVQDNPTRTSFRKEMLYFEEIETGELFLYSLNHFKAKTGNGTGTNANQNDGQGAWNADRVEEAQSVITMYKRLIPSSKDHDILIMGDLNAYGKEDPIKLLLENGMIDLHRAYHADSSYSYQYSGLAGYLDHALCNSTLYPQITGMAALHINSDENDRYTYDKSSGDNTMFRCSDHDPVLVGLKLDHTTVYEPKPEVNSMEILQGRANQLFISAAYTADEEGQNSYYAIYDVSGRPIQSARIENAYQAIDLPSAPGVYILYVYFDSKVYPYKFIVR